MITLQHCSTNGSYPIAIRRNLSESCHKSMLSVWYQWVWYVIYQNVAGPVLQVPGKTYRDQSPFYNSFLGHLVPFSCILFFLSFIYMHSGKHLYFIYKDKIPLSLDKIMNNGKTNHWSKPQRPLLPNHWRVNGIQKYHGPCYRPVIHSSSLLLSTNWRAPCSMVCRPSAQVSLP